jgi:hypothetical protein
MKKRTSFASTISRSPRVTQFAAAMAVILSTLLACAGVAADDTDPHPYAVAPSGSAAQFGTVEASGLRWRAYEPVLLGPSAVLPRMPFRTNVPGRMQGSR